jgi:hypothetical protein
MLSAPPRNPLPAFAEITFPAPGAVPPMATLLDVAAVAANMPEPKLPSGPVPVAFKPMIFP